MRQRENARPSKAFRGRVCECCKSEAPERRSLTKFRKKYWCAVCLTADDPEIEKPNPYGPSALVYFLES